MNKQNYLTTGEVAKMMNITKNTLFHYDDIDLFKPEIVLENEYRYYSIYQLELLDTILLLKELGMPLKQIKEFMQTRTINTVESTFDTMENQIDKQIERLNTKKRWLQLQKDKIKQYHQTDFNSITIQELGPYYYLKTNNIVSSDKAYIEVASEIIMELEKHHPEIYSDLGYKIHKNKTSNEEDYLQGNVILFCDEPPALMHYDVLPKQNYLVGYFQGDYLNGLKVYTKMLEYANMNQLSLDEYFYEMTFIDALFEQNNSNYKTRIIIPIK